MTEKTSSTVTDTETKQPSPYNATLIEREDMNPALAVFKVAYDAGEVPDFEPGQYTTLGVVDPVQPPPNPKRPNRGPKLIRRAYSIASSPKLKSHLEFYIVRVEEGKLTPLLWEMKEGDRIFMDERIKGKFTLDDVPDGKDLIMVGTGTGAAPFRSMLHTYRGTGRYRRFVLLDGCRYVADLGYLDEFTKLAEEDENFFYLPTVTREPDDHPWPGLRGRVHPILEPDRFKELTGFDLDPEQCVIFLCGSPQMIDQACENLGKHGFVVKDRDHPEGNLHFERYW